VATTFDGLNSVDSWGAELRRLSDVEDTSALAGIWEISVNIRRRAGNSHIALILAAMSA
jgi:hypothetical protein